MDFPLTCLKCDTPTNDYNKCSACRVSYCNDCSEWIRYDISPSNLIKLVDRKEFDLPECLMIQKVKRVARICPRCLENTTIDEMKKKRARTMAKEKWAKQKKL